MKPKILLMNYTEVEAKEIAKETGLKVIRGYVSESTGTSGAGKQRSQIVKFYSPEAFYECDMVFIKLPASTSINEEFNERAVELNIEEAQKFKNYWRTRKRLITVFVGDTNLTSLWHFGIPVTLVKSSGNDTTSITWKESDEDNDMYHMVQNIDSSLKLPTQRYIETGFEDRDNGRDMYYAYGTKWTSYSWNVNGDELAVALSKGNDDYSRNNPGALVIGQPKKITTITNRIIKFFGEHMEVFSVGDEWRQSDEFLPSGKIGNLKDDINKVIKDAREQINATREEIKTLRSTYSFVQDLVTQQGTSLVQAVLKAIGEVLGLDVVDSDEENDGAPIEDVFVTLSKDRQISIEVKGTTKPAAPLEYTQQPFQHITRRGYGKTVEPALILNHDMNKYPPQRTDAYKDKDKEPLIEGLHFIDTRVLVEVVKDVIDEKITKEEGVEILFGEMGRVQYDYNTYRENKDDTDAKTDADE